MLLTLVDTYKSPVFAFIYLCAACTFRTPQYSIPKSLQINTVLIPKLNCYVAKRPLHTRTKVFNVRWHLPKSSNHIRINLTTSNPLAMQSCPTELCIYLCIHFSLSLHFHSLFPLCASVGLEDAAASVAGLAIGKCKWGVPLHLTFALKNLQEHVRRYKDKNVY